MSDEVGHYERTRTTGLSHFWPLLLTLGPLFGSQEGVGGSRAYLLN
jgi:hypothetical protein